MKDFEYFIKNADVKKQAVDKNLSDSLIKDSKDRLEYAKSSVLSESNAKFIYENVYEALREAADSILVLNGFKSFSHEASISFLQQFDEFSAVEIAEFNRMRIKRNGLKYYGKPCTVADANEVIEFAGNLIKKFVALQRKFQKISYLLNIPPTKVGGL